MWSVTKKIFLKIIMLFILILIVYSAINTKSFETQLFADKESSDMNISNVTLKGTVIKFPLEIHYIKGSLVIDDKTYKLTNYRKTGFNDIKKTGIYKLQFIDRDNLDFFYGTANLFGDIIYDDLEHMDIHLNITDKNNGSSHTQVIKCYTVEKKRYSKI
jgi:hypothetical protein